MRGKFELDLLRDDAGNAVVVTGATVTVLVEGTGLPADLYDDITGIAGPGNPFTVAGSTIEFFAEQDNRYRIDITTLSGFSRTLRYRDVTIYTQDIKDYADAQIAVHSADVDNVHGIASGDAVESVSGAQAKADIVQTNLSNHIIDATPHPNLTIDFDSVTYPTSLKIGDPIHNDTLTEFVTHGISAGVTHDCAITDNGDGTVDIDAGYALLRATADPHSSLYAIEVAAQLGIALTDNSENYVYLDYNAGSPIWQVSTSRDSFNCLDKCIGYYIYREGTALNIITALEQNVDGNRKARRLFLKFSKFIHAEGGTQLGGTGLSLTVTSGSFFYMLEEIPHLAFDTSVSGVDNQNVFTLWYRDGIGGWVQTANEKVIDTTVYDNNSGTPIAISNNKYGISWVYLVQDSPSSLHVVMGQADYSTVADAQVASPPSALPGLLGAHSSLIGFVIYLKSAVVFADVLSAFTQQFTASASTTHNGLAGLQGGTTDQYYHMTLAEYTAYGYHTRARTITSPNATVPVHSLTAAGAETNIDIALIPKGTGAILADIPDGTASGGNKRGDYAVDLQLSRLDATSVASGNYSFTACYDSRASGAYSIAIGRNADATNTDSIAIGPLSNANGIGSICIGNGTVTGQDAVGIQGTNSISDGYSSINFGNGADARGTRGKKTFGGGNFGGSATGVSQVGTHIVIRETTDSTPSILAYDNVDETVVNFATTILDDSTAYAITARVIGRDTSTGDVYHVVVEGTAKRGVGAATTVLDGTPVYTTISQSAGAAGWSVSLVANTTRGSAEIQVTGETGTTIHWVCKFDTVEVG